MPKTLHVPFIFQKCSASDWFSQFSERRETYAPCSATKGTTQCVEAPCLKWSNYGKPRKY